MLPAVARMGQSWLAVQVPGVRVVSADKKLWIVGAGGHGREVETYVRQIIEAGQATWSFAGFIDDVTDRLATFDPGAMVRGPIAEVHPQADELFFVAIANPRAKLKIARDLRAKGARFATLLHPTVVLGEPIGPRFRVGEGCLFGPLSGGSCDITVGDFVTVGAQTGLGHDCILNDGCTLSAFVEVTGGAVLEEGVFLGSHAVVTPNVRMGAYSRAFAGAVVMKDVPAEVQVGGNPARAVPNL